MTQKIAFISLLISFLFLQQACREPIISTVSVAELKTGNWEDNIGKPMLVSGFIVSAGCGKFAMVSNMAVFERNTIANENEYALFTPESMRDFSAEVLHGAEVKMLCTLSKATDNTAIKLARLYGNSSLARLTLVGELKVVTPQPTGTTPPKEVDICGFLPPLCTFGIETTNHYAILYSGGSTAEKADVRYWNDISFMYLTLCAKYGYSAERIIVIYKDGVAECNNLSNIEVDYPASVLGVKAAFADIKAKMDTDDDFFFYASNHGTGYNAEYDMEKKCEEDTDGDELDKTYNWDEGLSYFEEDVVWLDDEMAEMVNDLSFGRMIAVIEPCFSGGLIGDLRGNNRLILTACDESEFSAAYSFAPFDEFSYYFISALYGSFPNDNTKDTFDPDTDNDGKVSLLEAFLFSKKHITVSAQHPMYEDNGDGIGTKNPTKNGVDGSKGAVIFTL